MRKSSHFFVGITTLCVFVGVVILSFAIAHSGNAAPAIPTLAATSAGLCKPVPTQVPSGPVAGGCVAPTPIRVIGPNSPGSDAGIPAIKPQTTTTGPAVAAFDTQTVQTYVLAHPSAGKIQSSGPATVVSIQFITGQQVDTQIRSQSGVAATRLVCLVKLVGKFSVAGPAGLGVGTFNALYQVYDAHTGNLLYQRSA